MIVNDTVVVVVVMVVVVVAAIVLNINSGSSSNSSGGSSSSRPCLHVPVVEGIGGKAATQYPSGDRQQTGEALTHERDTVEPPAACTSETAPALSGLMLSGTTSTVVSVLPMPPTVNSTMTSND